MNAPRKSDRFVVPAKSANNTVDPAGAESMEGRGLANRNVEPSSPHRTQSRVGGSRGLLGVREAAERDGKLKFTALFHHLTLELLRASFFDLKKDAAAGVDEVTWREYERGLEARLDDLHGRIHRGAYRAQPSKRTWIPKTDGRLRPLGIAALEDKIVQQAARAILQQIYEVDFQGFSYGFRPGRGCHQALDALAYAVSHKRVNWVLDADIQGFFDNIDHAWLMKFLEHRISDRRMLRLLQKWLKAGVSEDGQWSASTVGTPQGAVISPLLANVCLHYVLDLWIDWWRKNRARGDVVIVRYADDFVIGFEHAHEARQCWEELKQRFAKFGLTLHPTKTRLIEFGRFAAERRQRRGEGPPESFDFLGFTHRCGKTRERGWFKLVRTTVAKRMRATLVAIKDGLRRRMHQSLGEAGRWLRSVVQGWLNYHAVPGNSRRLIQFVDAVTKHWLRTLQRRSQTGRDRWTWPRMHRIAHRYLPRPCILHPYPDDRFRVQLKARAV